LTPGFLVTSPLSFIAAPLTLSPRWAFLLWWVAGSPALPLLFVVVFVLRVPVIGLVDVDLVVFVRAERRVPVEVVAGLRAAIAMSCDGSVFTLRAAKVGFKKAGQEKAGKRSKSMRAILNLLLAAISLASLHYSLFVLDLT
jgi:hypothetical protein